MDKSEAKSAVKALYLQSAALAGLEVRAHSPERLVELVDQGFERVSDDRKSEAVANLLKVISATLMHAQKNNLSALGESDIDAGKDSVCPVFPFD